MNMMAWLRLNTVLKLKKNELLKQEVFIISPLGLRVIIWISYCVIYNIPCYRYSTYANHWMTEIKEVIGLITAGCNINDSLYRKKYKDTSYQVLQWQYFLVCKNVFKTMLYENQNI